MSVLIKSDRKYLKFITAVSVVVPILVAVLLFAPLGLGLGEAGWVRSLPGFNALINSLTAVVLIIGYWAVKNGNISLHRSMMMTAFAFGTVFLLSYVVYHASVPTTVFGDLDHDGELSPLELEDVGSLRTAYVIVLLSHIGLSMVVVPFVLLAFYYALSGNIVKHRKIVKFTLPVWLYVSGTGVLVYWLISPYY